MRPLMPPASLTRLKAVSMPSFICRPSSLAEPENGATIPKRISFSLMPRTLDAASGTAWVTVGATAAVCWAGAGAGVVAVVAGGMIDAIGAGAALAADGAITAASDGPEIDRSRSASWRSIDLQSVRPEVMAPRPSITWRSNCCAISMRSPSLFETSRITARNLSATIWMRDWAMSGQASAAPRIGPTRPARSRTTLVLSPGAAVAAELASRKPPNAIAQRARRRNLRSALIPAP